MLEFWLWSSVYILSWPMLVLLFLAGVVFEHTENHGLAVLLGIISAVASYFYFGIPLMTVLEWSAAYLAVGVVWSFWRYHRYVEKKVEDIKAAEYGLVFLESKIANLSPGKNLDLITSWIIIWPFSAVEHILSDVINMIQALVTDVFRSVYNRIYTSHVQVLKDMAEKGKAPKDSTQ